MTRDPFSLDGKTILVTGASSGIGRQCCITASRRGARTVATGRDPERLADTMGSLSGDGHRSVVADLTTAEGFEAVIAAVDGLDGVVHSAGISIMVPLKFVTEDALRDQQRINLEVPLLLTRDLFKQRKLEPQASVIFLSSAAAFRGEVGQSVYASTKAALVAATRVIAKEVAVRRIRVNCLCPGMVRTPMLAIGTLTEEDYEREESKYPLGYGEPEDVAHAAVFLLSDASKWITGTSLVLDGGRS
jgi:NAD(P)-dependent dehydrogenase (short-subunit alcohol dehydrogenase family)